MNRLIQISLILLAAAGLARAELKVEQLGWREACDGSALEIVREDGSVRALRASARHHHVTVEWTVHFVAGSPVTAEYRRSRRERFADGERGGELTGKRTLEVLKTWQAREGKFQVKDPARARELRHLLSSLTS